MDFIRLIIKRKPYLLTVLIISTALSVSHAQDLTYAREVVSTLASDELKGRGYVDDGDRKAAEYIESQFKNIGLAHYGKTYAQKFKTPVNTFPAQMKLSIDGNELIPGKDFLIDPSSSGIKGRYETVMISANGILDENILYKKIKLAKGKFLVLSPFARSDYSKNELSKINEMVNFLKYHKDSPVTGILTLTTNKLTWSVSTFQSSNAVFTIKVTDPNLVIHGIEVYAKSKFLENHQTQNIIGFVEGERNDSTVVLVAHYDHLGMMGEEVIFPGANDNASGIAMLLNLAKHYQDSKPKFRTVFIAFAGEELGLLGAKHYVESPLFSLKSIKFLINFDISGTGDDGIQVVNGSVYRDKFDLLSTINTNQNLLKQVKIRGAACNSDHCMFDKVNVPNFFIYTLGGIQAYHDIDDKAETLPLTEFVDYNKLVIQFLDKL